MAALVALVAVPLVLLAWTDRSVQEADQRRPGVGAFLDELGVYPPDRAEQVRDHRLDRPALVSFFRADCAKCERTASALATLSEEAIPIDIHAVVPPSVASDAPVDADITAPDGALELTIDDLVTGEGRTADTGDTALAHLLLVRGDNLVTLFNTWDRGEPLEILLEDGYTLPGLQQALTGMTVGGTRAVTMPPDLAFGPDGEPGLGLPAGRDLIAIIELLGVW